MLDKLDKLEERINHFFTKGKNANERCFDFFLRSVTFFIILLAILCYGGLVKANSLYDTWFGGVDYSYFINSTDVYNYYLEYDRQDTTFAMPSSGISWLGNTFVNPFSNSTKFDEVSNFIDTHYSISDVDNYKYSYTLIRRRTGWEYGGNYEFTIYKVYSNDECFVVCDTISPTSSSFNYYICALDGSEICVKTLSMNYISSSDYHLNINNSTTTDKFTGSNTDNVNFLFYCDMPIYHMFYSNDGVSGNYTYQNVHSMISGIRSGDVTVQINPYNDIFNPHEPEEPQESNANHMYFQNVRMCLTAQGENNNLSSSSLAIGCEVDDYIKNHLSDYKVYVSCQLNYKDSVYTYNPTFGEMLPLSLFYNQAYVKGLTEIFSNMPWQNLYPNFYSYYRHLGDDYNVFTKNVSGKNTRFEVPTITDVIQFTSGFFQTDKSIAHFPSNFDINTFQLDVSVVITDSDTLDTKSGVFTQRFDFLNGTTSILKADGLVNENPWTGPSEPQANPFGSGSTNANGGVVQNNNQTVNINIDNRFKNAVTDGVNDEDTDNTVDNMKKVFDEFKGGLKTISESSMDENGNPNGFLSLLEHTYNFIPGINYIKTAIIVIVALAVILFILKVLLF